MKREWQTRVAAIAGITVLDLYALHLGHNGILLATSLAAIAGIGGYSLARAREGARGGADVLSEQ